MSSPTSTRSTALQGTREDTRTSCGDAATHFTPLSPERRPRQVDTPKLGITTCAAGVRSPPVAQPAVESAPVIHSGLVASGFVRALLHRTTSVNYRTAITELASGRGVRGLVSGRSRRAPQSRVEALDCAYATPARTSRCVRGPCATPPPVWHGSYGAGMSVTALAGVIANVRSLSAAKRPQEAPELARAGAEATVAVSCAEFTQVCHRVLR
jgi:hypothetical protein